MFSTIINFCQAQNKILIKDGTPLGLIIGINGKKKHADFQFFNEMQTLGNFLNSQGKKKGLGALG